MQITRAEVIPAELKIRRPVRLAGIPAFQQVTAIFVRLETRQGQSAWGCTVAQPDLTGEKPGEVLRACRDCADLVADLHPLNLEFALAELATRSQAPASALCAFDLAFHDLLSLAAGLPLYRLLGGYRDRIQTSATIPLAPLDESVELACERARGGFRLLKVKGGLDPAADVARIQAIRRALPEHHLRLDADGGYTVRQALDVARALQGSLEMLEQPTPAADLPGLRQVKEFGHLPMLADQSLSGPESALQLAAQRIVDGFCIKLASCGGLRCARQIDAIARAGKIASMVSCFIEPALLIGAGLSLALSSPNVAYADLDGCLDLLNDPSLPGWHLEEGWLVAAEAPGLGCALELG
jgi:L-alanine-DL-glutamate epimerase-like enolase superfamily enzyme